MTERVEHLRRTGRADGLGPDIAGPRHTPQALFCSTSLRVSSAS